MNDNDRPSDDSATPDEVDDGLAFAFGEESQQDPSPSVLDRIGEVTGSTPKVSLRDANDGQTPMLKPLGPDDHKDAGKYMVQGELGRGGVGAVHKGHDQDLGRDVAMKFLHDKYKDEPSILHRFVEEAQIGGQLQHPGIVPVYDLGMSDGKPFFTMKLVKGKTLAQALAERESVADDRRRFLAIFEQICQTMAYAHARGVVHRDLKPANIMIGSFGEVQVVDWGMGKVLERGGVADEKRAAEMQASIIETVRSSGHGTQSVMGSVMGTPAYMPPEQALGDVERMDERSDVFALGAILCEILTGLPPYVGELDELIGMAAMAKLDAAHERLANCGADDELVELTKHCLVPAAAARPKSAEVVAGRVRDYLAQAEAQVHAAKVEAAEAKVRAAAMRRTQRLGAALLVTFAAGLLASLWLWDRAVTSEADARRDLSRAVEMKTLLTDMMQEIRPAEADAKETRVLRDILDQTSARIEAGQISDPLVRAELQTVLGEVETSIARNDRAQSMLTEALATRKELLGTDHHDTLVTSKELVKLLLKQGKLNEAEELAAATLASMQRVIGPEHRDTLAMQSNLAAVHIQLRHYKKAVERLRPTVATMRRVLDDDDRHVTATMLQLGQGLLLFNKLDKAERVLNERAAIVRRTRGDEHIDAFLSVALLADVRAAQYRWLDAKLLYQQVDAAFARKFGEDHPERVKCIMKLAQFHRLLGEHDDAVSTGRQSVERCTRALGADHRLTLRMQRKFSLCLAQAGQHKEALELAEQVLARQTELFGADDEATLQSAMHIGMVYLRIGNLSEAETRLTDAVTRQTKALGSDHVHTIESMEWLHVAVGSQERWPEALELSQRIMAAHEKASPPYLPKRLAAATNLASTLFMSGAADKAVPYLKISIPGKILNLGFDHPWTHEALRLMQAIHTVDLKNQAEANWQVALEPLHAAAQSQDATPDTLDKVANALLRLPVKFARDPALALQLAERAVALDEDSDSIISWRLLGTLAAAQHRNDDSKAAAATQRKAIAKIPDGAPEQARAEYERRLKTYESAAK